MPHGRPYFLFPSLLLSFSFNCFLCLSVFLCNSVLPLTLHLPFSICICQIMILHLSNFHILYLSKKILTYHLFSLLLTVFTFQLSVIFHSLTFLSISLVMFSFSLYPPFPACLGDGDGSGLLPSGAALCVDASVFAFEVANWRGNRRAESSS